MTSSCSCYLTITFFPASSSLTSESRSTLFLKVNQLWFFSFCLLIFFLGSKFLLDHSLNACLSCPIGIQKSSLAKVIVSNFWLRSKVPLTLKDKSGESKLFNGTQEKRKKVLFLVFVTSDFCHFYFRRFILVAFGANFVVMEVRAQSAT